MEVTLLGAFAIVLMAVGTWLLRRSRVTAAQREKKRRTRIYRTGRMGDANVIDVRDSVLFYEYEISGVAYTTSQDASDFRDRLPAEVAHLIGPAGIKYDSKNPANSIIICEEWSGLRPGPLQFQPMPLKEGTHL